MPAPERTVIWSRAAKQDVRRIWRHYVRAASLPVADRLFRELLEAGERTSTRALLWRTRDDLSPGLRVIRVPPYLPFYQIVEGGTEVVRVLHERRNLPAALKKAAR